ncbi:MAG TPA: amidohydrolase [Planctomycetaceae bacterium]|nr:amidohydrolase [Planctomycetaceae bacterium]HRF02041.1 amidohydrolase family protein [Pirellulaceae bacterium]
MPRRTDDSTRTIDRRTFLASGAAAVGATAIGSATLSATTDLAASSNDGARTGYIDSHVHVWTDDVETYPLDPKWRPEQMEPRAFLPETLLSHARPCGVDRIVIVQMSYYGSDNRYMLDVMQSAPESWGGIGIVDPNDHPAEAMRRLAAKRVRGFRVQPHDATPDRWLDDDASTAMWRAANDLGVAICLLIDPPFLASVERMLRKFPATRVVIDHFARIGIDGMVRPADLDALCALAEFEQVHVKVSAYYALGRKTAPYDDLGPMIRRVIDAYGSSRAMWGSDSPYQVLEGHTYADSLALLTDRLELSEAERNDLLRGTAERLFFA